MVFSGTVPRGETHPIPTTADQSDKDGTVGKALGPVEGDIGVLGFELDTEVAKSAAGPATIDWFVVDDTMEGRQSTILHHHRRYDSVPSTNYTKQ